MVRVLPGRHGGRGKKLGCFAAALIAWRAETVADFREFYGVDLPTGWGPAGEVTEADAARWQLLYSGLPARSRTGRLVDPDNAWGDAERLLRAIEYDVRQGFYMFTEDAKKRANRPRPLRSPGEAAGAAARAERAEAARGEIDEAFGMGV